jgi:type IV secretion system protein VirB10
MSLSEKAFSIIKDPENDHISKGRVALVVTLSVLSLAVVIAAIGQMKKNSYLAEQEAKLQQRRSQASDTPMATSGVGQDTKDYLDKQTRLKNQLAHNATYAAPNNNLNDPLAATPGANVPPIVGANGQPINAPGVAQRQNQPQYVQQQPVQQSQDPIAQEYQNERLDKIKHKYASYRADTLLGPQPPAKNDSSSGNQSIPQPTKLAANQAPSDGFAKASSKNSQNVPFNNPNDSSGENNDQNMQGKKNTFFSDKAKDMFSDDYINATVKDPISKYEIKAGTPIPAFLITPINSDLPGMITAQVARNIYDTKTGNYLLIPGGSRLIGVYDSNISYGQSRVMVAWNRVIFPSGASYGLYGMPGTDVMGISGLTGEVNNHYGRIYGSALVMGVITAGMQYSQNSANPSSQAGATYTNATVGQSLASGLGQQLGQAGLQVTQKNLNVQPTIEVPPSQQINIMLSSDVVLRPINKKQYLGNGVQVMRGN